MRIVLLGAPGSGKGTQGRRLQERLGAAHVASGELLRAHVESGSELGRRVAGFLARGDLVPDDVVLDVVCDAVRDAVARTGGYILDGFPRTRAQAERAYELASDGGLTASAAVYLRLPDAAAQARLAGRAGGGRSDDASGAVVAHRLALFHESTAPVLDFYRARGILVTVDAARPVEAVTEATLAAIAGTGAAR